MTENERDQLLIYIDTHIDKLQKVTDLLKGLKHPGGLPGSVQVDYSGGRLIIEIHNLEELHLVRQYLRVEWGAWKDKLGLIWACWDANANYDGEHAGVPVTIRLSCPIDEFPKELLKHGCGFKKVSREEWDFVCSKEGA